MLRFFSKIRLALIGTSSGRYLVYAVGEITLVVFGILIALQVNNWNEIRQDRNSERDLLAEFYNGFIVDLENLAEDTLRTRRAIQRTSSLIEILQDPLQVEPPDSLLGAPFSAAIISINTGVYELLKNKGTDLISNNDLRRRLFYFYETELDWYGNLQQRYYDADNLFESYYSQLVYREVVGSNGSVFKTSRWLEMKTNQFLIEKLKDLIARRHRELDWMFEFMDKIYILNGMINNEMLRLAS